MWRVMAAGALLACGCAGEDVEPGDTGPDDGPPAPMVEAPPEGPAIVEAYRAGAFSVLDTFQGTLVGDVYGRALSVRYLDGTSAVSVQLSGLQPSTEHNVHVHVWPCAYYAGGHYEIDPTIDEVVESNEVWPSFTTDAEGDGMAHLSLAHRLRGDAMSVIVHDPVTNDKLACADLVPEVVNGERGSGTFAPFADADPVIDAGLGGTASLTVTGSSSSVSVSLSGLDEGSTYTAHVHALPCDTDYGGGHYKLDPSVEDTVETNEIWPPIEVQPGGSANATVDVQHGLRADAQAIVVHRGGPKVGCADLTRESYLGHTAIGSPTTFPAAAEKGAGNLSGAGTILRRLDGVTVIALDLQGLAANTEYPVHLHDRPCAVADGGGHYLIDPTIADTVEENEVWARLVADASGAAVAVGYAEHVARADAQSLVIHDDDDGARLACIDLD